MLENWFLIVLWNVPGETSVQGSDHGNSEGTGAVTVILSAVLGW
jgi:hypothetical protein